MVVDVGLRAVRGLAKVALPVTRVGVAGRTNALSVPHLAVTVVVALHKVVINADAALPIDAWVPRGTCLIILY